MLITEFLAECKAKVEAAVSDLIVEFSEPAMMAYAAYRWGFARENAKTPALDAVTLMTGVPEDALQKVIAEAGPAIQSFVDEYGEGFTTDVIMEQLHLVPGNPNMGLKGQSFDGSDKNTEQSPGILYHLENLGTDSGYQLRQDILAEASDEAKAFFDDLDYDPVRVIDATKLSDKMWHKVREFALGASEMGAIDGTSPFQNALSVWHDKLNHTVEAEDSEEDRAFKEKIFAWGHQVESYLRMVVLTYPDFEGCKVLVEPMMFSNERRPFMTCNLDAILAWPDGHYSILEFKGPTPFAKDHYANGAIPAYYMAQMQAQMMHLNVDDAYLVALFDRDNFTVSRAVRDLDYQMELVIRASDFWNKHVMSGIEPPLNGQGSLIIKTVRRYGGKGNKNLPTMTLDEKTYAKLLEKADAIKQEQKQHDDESKRLKKEYDDAIAPIVAAMGQTTRATCTDSSTGFHYDCTFTERQSTPQMKKADIELMQKGDPQLYQSVQPYITYRGGSRPFTVKKYRG